MLLAKFTDKLDGGDAKGFGNLCSRTLPLFRKQIEQMEMISPDLDRKTDERVALRRWLESLFLRGLEIGASGGSIRDVRIAMGVEY